MEPERLLKDINFLTRLADAPDMDAVIKLFSENGAEVTEEYLLSRALPNSSELTEYDLEVITGGTSRSSGFIDWVRRRIGLS